MTVSPEEAIDMRHSKEMSAASHAYQQESQWDMHGDLTSNPNHSSPLDIVLQRLTRYPKTNLELIATILFGIANLSISDIVHNVAV